MGLPTWAVQRVGSYLRYSGGAAPFLRGLLDGCLDPPVDLGPAEHLALSFRPSQPAWIRCWIMLRSNSAKASHTWKINFPHRRGGVDGLLVDVKIDSERERARNAMISEGA